MAKRSATTEKQKAYRGSALILLGLGALVVNVVPFANLLAHLLQTSKNGIAGVAPTVGLSFARAAGSILLGQVDYLPLASRILLLFFAMLALTVGLVLTCSRSRKTSSRSSSPGEREAR